MLPLITREHNSRTRRLIVTKTCYTLHLNNSVSSLKISRSYLPLPFAEILRLSWLRLLRRAAATLDVPTDLCQMLEILGLKRSLKLHKLLRRWQKAAPFRQRLQLLSKAITRDVPRD